MRLALRNIWRLLRIAWILARYGALFPLTDAGIAPLVTFVVRLAPKRRGLGRPGQRLARALQVLGPSFIKFGQALSTRPDLIGDSVAQDLSELQDKLPPFPGREARAIVEREFDRPIAALYSQFEDTPIAAASIAQVHLAVTTDGEPVAVKILRPGIERAFARDLELFYWLAGLAERALPSTRRLKPVEVIRTFADTVAIEMDLRFEAAAATELRQNFTDEPTFRVPAVDWRRTSRRVLTLERVEGLRFDDRAAIIAAGHNPVDIVTISARAFFNQVFRDGFFHADMHPGNLMIDAEGNLVAVDFGIMGRLDADTRRYLAEMLLGFLTGDYERVARVHFEAGYVPEHKSKAAFIQAVRSIGEPIFGKPLNEISIAQLLGHLFQVTRTFDMQTQPQLLLLQKTLLMAEGLSRHLCPEQNMWALAQPLIEEWARENLSPEARVRHAAIQAVESVARLPRLVERAERALASLDGGLKLDPETLRALRGGRPSRLGGLHAVLGLIAGLLAALIVLQLT